MSLIMPVLYHLSKKFSCTSRAKIGIFSELYTLGLPVLHRIFLLFQLKKLAFCVPEVLNYQLTLCAMKNIFQNNLPFSKK
jgi:hypothetical protein